MSVPGNESGKQDMISSQLLVFRVWADQYSLAIVVVFLGSAPTLKSPREGLESWLQQVHAICPWVSLHFLSKMEKT